MTHRDLCLRAMVLFEQLAFGPQDEVINQWLDDLMKVDQDAYQKNPADKFVRQFTRKP